MIFKLVEFERDKLKLKCRRIRYSALSVINSSLLAMNITIRPRRENENCDQRGIVGGPLKGDFITNVLQAPS